jgi:hypothetical protein
MTRLGVYTGVQVSVGSHPRLVAFRLPPEMYPGGWPRINTLHPQRGFRCRWVLRARSFTTWVRTSVLLKVWVPA